MFHVVKNKEKNYMGFPVHIANFVPSILQEHFVEQSKPLIFT